MILAFVNKGRGNYGLGSTAFTPSDFLNFGSPTSSAEIGSEIDPTVAGHIKNITVANISTWNTALQPANGFKVLANQPISGINSFTEYETYYRGAFAASSWPGVTNYMNIFSLKYQEPSVVTQFGFSPGDKAFMRYGSSSGASWGTWKEFWHSGNLINPISRVSSSTISINSIWVGSTLPSTRSSSILYFLT